MGCYTSPSLSHSTFVVHCSTLGDPGTVSWVREKRQPMSHGLSRLFWKSFATLFPDPTDRPWISKNGPVQVSTDGNFDLRLCLIRFSGCYYFI